MMKWPNSITMMRHGESAYNNLKRQKADDPKYQEFKTLFEEDFTQPRCRKLAEELIVTYCVGVSDFETPLTDAGREQAFRTGVAFAVDDPFPPDVVLVSPYLRTRQTWGAMQFAGYRANNAPVVFEDRIREQEHGLVTVYNDWRFFCTLHPEQKTLYDLTGRYWYQFPQGESVSMVRDRARDVASMCIREYASLNVLMITHHLLILSVRANFERLAPEAFIQLDEHETPLDCGITRYVGDPRRGKEGRLELVEYNKRYY